MGTRATFHFRDQQGQTVAIIYKGMNGGPDYAGVDLYKFLDDVKEHAPYDTRFHHPEVLAARYVVWLSQRILTQVNDFGSPVRKEKRPWTLDFRWMEIVDKDPPGIEYRYFIDCTTPILPSRDDEPKIHGYAVKFDGHTREYIECEEVHIPRAGVVSPEHLKQRNDEDEGANNG